MSPSPPPRPALSPLTQTLRFMRQPQEFLRATRAECGDLFALRLLGLGRWVFLCSSDLLQLVTERLRLTVTLAC